MSDKGNSGPRNLLAVRILIICFVSLTLPLIIYFTLELRGSYRTQLKDSVQILQEVGRSRAMALSLFYQNDIQLINTIEEVLRPVNIKSKEDLEKLDVILTRFTQTTSLDFAALIYESEPGTYDVIAASKESIIGLDLAGIVFSRATQEKVASFPIITRTGIKTLNFVKQITTLQVDKGKIYLLAGNSMARIVEKLFQSVDASFPTAFSLVSPQGVIIASSDPDLENVPLRILGDEDIEALKTHDPFLLGSIKKDSLNLTKISQFPGVVTFVHDGNKVLGVEVPVEGTRMQLLLDAPEREVFSEQNKNLIQGIICYSAIVFFGALVCYYLTMKMVVPFRHLWETMKKVGAGNTEARYSPHDLGFEFNYIGERFNEMLQSLLYQKAQAENERVKRETLTRELLIGHDIQKAMLPQVMPKIKGLEMTTRLVPAKEVSGDFYDVFSRVAANGDGQELVATVADASDKGISACLYSLSMRSLLRSQFTMEQDLAKVLRKTNQLFCLDTEETCAFVTALTVAVNPYTKIMRYFCAGHNPGFVLRGEEVISIRNDGIALGITDLGEVKETELAVQEGDLVFLYTDGVTEAHGENDELYGEERAISFLRENRHLDLEELANGLLKDLETFQGSAGQHDDVTFILLRLL